MMPVLMIGSLEVAYFAAAGEWLPLSALYGPDE
jgi:hypothetical protein